MSKIMTKVKGFVKRHSKALVVSALSALTMCFSVVTSFAADATTASSAGDNIVAQFSTSLQEMQGDIVNLILSAVPIALTIFGLIIAVNKCIQVVKGMIGKS